MTTSELRAEAPTQVPEFPAPPPTQLLESALLHVLSRDEPLPARWRAEPFVLAVTQHRADLAQVVGASQLDAAASTAPGSTFQTAVAGLANDPLAVAIAIRRLELTTGSSLPAWPAIVRRGVAQGVARADTERWFG